MIYILFKFSVKQTKKVCWTLSAEILLNWIIDMTYLKNVFIKDEQQNKNNSTGRSLLLFKSQGYHIIEYK